MVLYMYGISIDVAALGGEKNQYCITTGNKRPNTATMACGTSAATPVVASVVAKLNEIRLKAGDIDDSSTSFFLVNSRTLMGCTDLSVR